MAMAPHPTNKTVALERYQSAKSDLLSELGDYLQAYEHSLKVGDGFHVNATLLDAGTRLQSVYRTYMLAKARLEGMG